MPDAQIAERMSCGRVLAPGAILALAGAWLPVVSPASPAAAGPPAEPAVTVEQAVTDQVTAHGSADFWVVFDDQADLTGADRITDWAERGQFVYHQLTEAARESQAGFVADAAARHVDYQPFWIINAVLVRDGDQTTLDLARSSTGVAEVRTTRTYQLPEPVEPTEPGEAGIDAVEWGIANINADDVWDQFGIRGESVVVGSIDTGVQFDHPALVGQYRGNQGGAIDHNYHWWDPSHVCGNPSRVPCDNNGHGTHTMGTMAGDDGAGNQIGVAPGVRWITAKGCETNRCSESALLSSGQFMLAPTDLDGADPRPELRPHILNNSWGGSGGNPWYDEVVAAWTAAGTFPVFSNGNDGPACGTAGSPADGPAALAVGAYDINNEIYALGSRGPGRNDEIRPHLTAPGVAVRSSVPDDAYRGLSGTSMAAPHVSGTVALMWAAAPDLVGDLATTREILTVTATDVDDTSCGGEPGNNNVWGEGRLDALAAVDLSPRGPAGSLIGTVVDAATQEPIPGATVTVDLAGRPWQTRTGPDGGYSVGPLPVGTWPVTATTATHHAATKSVQIAEDQTATLDFALSPLPQLAGTVTDALGGGPLAGVVVTATAGADTRTATTGADGGYRLPLVAGTWEVTASVPSHRAVTEPVTIPEQGTLVRDFALPPLPQLAGTVTDALGAGPLAGVIVTATAAADTRTVTSGADGTYLLHLDLGVWNVTITRFNYLATARQVAVAQDGQQIALDLALDRIDPLWVARTDGPVSGQDFPLENAVSPDGSRVFVTGFGPGEGTARDYLTVAYDAGSGEELWTARYDGPGHADDFANALTVSPDGSRVFVTGRSRDPDPAGDYTTVAYDAATGDQLWVAQYAGPGGGADFALDMAVSPDGSRVFVSGRSPGEGTGEDFATVAYDAATGSELWVTRYDGTASGTDNVEALAVSPDGSLVFVTGRTFRGDTSFDFGTVAYDAATGDQRWVAWYDGPANSIDFSWKLGVSPDGSRVYVTGRSAGTELTWDFATVAYDAAGGGQLWVARYNGPAGGDDNVWALDVSPDGSRVFVTGQSENPEGGLDYATVGYDAAGGGQLWAARYDGPGRSTDVPHTVVVSPDGSRVFVSGPSRGDGTVDDFGTVAYDAATGQEHWVVRYDGPGHSTDFARLLSMSPDGTRVFVTGHSFGQGTSMDYATVAYDALLTALACLAPDPRATVVIGGVDSGVPNRMNREGCTINDLIKDEEPWPNHGMFMRHVVAVTDQLVTDELISAREQSEIVRAAARSDVGRHQRPS